MKGTLHLLLGLLLLSAQQVIAAEMNHDMGHEMHGQHDMDMDHADQKPMAEEQSDEPVMFLVKKDVDGYNVTFHVMLAGGMYHGGSHNLMIKIEQDGKAIADTLINSKVFYPNGAAESKMLIKMGDWYMNGFDFHGNKKHGLMILFKTADGKKHKTSVYYPEVK